MRRNTIKSNLKNPEDKGRLSGTSPSFKRKQQKREIKRRNMLHREHDPEESDLFPDVEAVRSMVMLKGEDELADEQSEVSWDGTAREERRSRRESTRSPRRSSNRHSRSSRHKEADRNFSSSRHRSQSRRRPTNNARSRSRKR